MQLEFIKIVPSYQCLLRSMDFWLKSITYYRKGGYLQVLLVLYRLYITTLQFHFLQMMSLSFSFPLPFFFSTGATLERSAARRSASGTSWWQHQSPKHINARMEAERRQLRRWLIRILPWLNEHSTSTAVAECSYQYYYMKDTIEGDLPGVIWTSIAMQESRR